MTLCPLRVSPTFRRNILLSSSRVKFRYKGQIVFCRIIATDDRIARLETLNTASDRRNWGILEYLGYSSLPLKGLSDGGHYSDVNTCRRTHLQWPLQRREHLHTHSPSVSGYSSSRVEQKHVLWNHKTCCERHIHTQIFNPKFHRVGGSSKEGMPSGIVFF